MQTQLTVWNRAVKDINALSVVICHKNFSLYRHYGLYLAAYRVAQKLAPFLYALTLPNINHFQNYFTVRIRTKFVIILSLKIPPHIKCVATLPCEKCQWHPKQRNRLDSSPGCFGATCKARSHATGTSVCSWQCVYLQQMVYQRRRITTINSAEDVLLYRSRLVFNCCF